MAVLALLVGGLVTRCLWFSWSPAMASAMVADNASMQALVAVGLVIVATLPVVVLLCVGAATFHGRRQWVRLWLPIAWVAGERVQATWTSVASDWLHTQVDVTQLMQALGCYGLVPTTWACLFVAASAGEALEIRRWRAFVPASIALVGLLAAPALPKGNLELLEGIGAVHMPTATQVPAVDRVDEDLRVLVWPEVSFAARPLVGEGPGAGAHFGTAPGGPGTSHVLGVETAPRYGRRNMAMVVDPEGVVVQARAKRVLFPVFERPFLGVGEAAFVPGERPAVLEIAGTKVIPLICGEFLTRALVAEGVAAGGEVLMVMARDRYQGESALADREVLAHLRLRAIEYGIPAVYASMGGQATFVSASGEVLARSNANDSSGVLTWRQTTGAEDRVPAHEPTVTVLYSRDSPWLRPDCMPGRCEYLAVEEMASCPERSSRTVVVSAHGDAERIAGLGPAELAALVACFEPELVVLDACFGATTPMLIALGEATDARVVAVPAFVAGRGLRYEPDFFSELELDRVVAAVRTDPPSPLYVGRPDPRALAEAEAAVATADVETLRSSVRSWNPALVGVRLATGQEVLVPMDWRRIGHPPDAQAPIPRGSIELGTAGTPRGGHVPRADPGPRRFIVHSLWLEGQSDEHRAELDRFLDCLLAGSNFADFWRGQVVVETGGSWVTSPPEGLLMIDDAHQWLEPTLRELSVDATPEGVTPIYLVYGNATTTIGPSERCGHCGSITVNDRAAGLAVVRTDSPCWPAQDPVRSLTQFAEHEMTCAIELALGMPHCAADGACEGNSRCSDPCSNFTGLYCPGAPEQSYTGCDGTPVKGWVVQKLSHKGWDGDDCPVCAPCDFTVRACSETGACGDHERP